MDGEHRAPAAFCRWHLFRVPSVWLGRDAHSRPRLRLTIVPDIFMRHRSVRR